MKKISIVIPCYNAERYLQECFDSVIRQTFGTDQLQVIFVNDASTDGTWHQITEYEKMYPDLVVAVNLAENHKQGGARNIGLRYADGEYVIFLDADDWLDATMCEKVYRKVKEYDVDILQFRFVYVYASQYMMKDEGCQYGFLDGKKPEVKKGMLLGTFFTFGSQNKVYRRALLEAERAEFLEGVVYEEPYFVYPLLLEAERFYRMEEGLYYYRHIEASVTDAYMKKKTKLYDHPHVQLELLKKIAKEKRCYLEQYYEEVEIYFLYTYYLETLYFAGHDKRFLGIDYFEMMQKNVLELFPEHENNTYLQLDEFGKLKQILQSLTRKFTQQELDEYCAEVARILG